MRASFEMVSTSSPRIAESCVYMQRSTYSICCTDITIRHISAVTGLDAC